MKLYVHYEDAHIKWTKRLTVEPDSTTLKRALAVFQQLFVTKFARELDLSQIVVLTERHQSESTRQQIADAKFGQTLQQLGICSSPDEDPESKSVACDVELVITATSASAVDHKSLEPPICKRVDMTAAVSYVDVGLRSVLDLALSHLKARRHRAAREAYETLVLSVDPYHPEALLGLGEVYFSIGKYGVAASKYFKVCWRRYNEQPRDKAYALMAITSGLKLAECQLKQRKFRSALTTLDGLQDFLRRHSRCRTFFCDSLEKERMEAQMDYIRACALYDLQTPAEQDTAISLLMHLLPDLQDPRVNLDALQLYARVAQDRGRKNEALSMLLRVLVGKSTDQSVRKQLADLLRGKNGMERLLCSVPPTTPSAAEAYAFTATILKDFGDVGASVQCFEHALSLTPTSAAYALNLAHTLEVCNRYEDAYNSLLAFLRANKSLHVLGNLSAADVVDALAADAWNMDRNSAQAEFARWSMSWNDGSGEGFAVVYRDGAKLKLVSRPNRSDLTEQELDLLACFFTLAKILFINGRVHALPGLVALLEPLRIGRQLHKTAIRNEQAYYLCITQLLCIEPKLTVPTMICKGKSGRSDPVDSAPGIPTFICGDSHTLATAWRSISLHGSPVQLQPALVTGLKHWHLRKESEFYPKVNFWNVLESLPRRSRVIFLFGEIDCREGILEAVELCKYETVPEGMEHTVNIFMDVLNEVVQKYQFEVYIHPVVPVLNETRPLVVQYNRIFKKKVTASTLCKWLDFFEDLIEGSPAKLRSQYVLDGTHLHPTYLTLLERELAILHVTKR